jgi:vacuolar-type H+-ATPase subunit F/Vma7
MSYLLVVTQPSLVPGFQLAGVNALGVSDFQASLEQVTSLLLAGEVGLLAIDEGLLEQIPPAFLHRLDSEFQVPFLAIPSGGPFTPGASRQQRLAQKMRLAIGFHITFKGEEAEKTV